MTFLYYITKVVSIITSLLWISNIVVKLGDITFMTWGEAFKPLWVGLITWGIYTIIVKIADAIEEEYTKPELEKVNKDHSKCKSYVPRDKR